MSKTVPETKYLNDYKTPAYLLERVELSFDLHASATRVTAAMHFYLNPDREGVSEPLLLDGEQLQLLEVKLDGRQLSPNEYLQDDENLQIDSVPEKFTLEIQTQIDPFNNTALEGLYQTSGIFCTQCEAEGFRHITYYPDR
ncbi:MAG: aminopeptidase N, partial [Desulfuromusa sp.]|nr:aminopeptidase N [Desulfuromusa sp.]